MLVSTYTRAFICSGFFTRLQPDVSHQSTLSAERINDQLRRASGASEGTGAAGVGFIDEMDSSW